MAEQETDQEEEQIKKSKKPLVIGLVLAVLLGGGGFFAVSTGMILAPAQKQTEEKDMMPDPLLPDVAFVPVQPLIINLGRDGGNHHLRFQAHLEVTKAAEAEVTTLLPRVTDVLNSYLRAVGVADLENPAALVRLRAQMLRRVQVVTGQDRVRDLLIMEFVVN